MTETDAHVSLGFILLDSSPVVGGWVVVGSSEGLRKGEEYNLSGGGIAGSSLLMHVGGDNNIYLPAVDVGRQRVKL